MGLRGTALSSKRLSLTAFTPDDAAEIFAAITPTLTGSWPSSHLGRSMRLPAPLTPEQAARVPKDLAAPYPGEVLVTAPKGAVIVINSSLWHAGTTNQSGKRRRVLHLTYTRRDLPQQLVQRQYLTRALYERMSPAHRYLLDIEPLSEGAIAMRSARGDRAGEGWWN